MSDHQSWTSAKPTTPGVYWWRFDHGDDDDRRPLIAVLRPDLSWEFPGVGLAQGPFEAWDLGAEWFGPIEPPS